MTTNTEKLFVVGALLKAAATQPPKPQPAVKEANAVSQLPLDFSTMGVSNPDVQDLIQAHNRRIQDPWDEVRLHHTNHALGKPPVNFNPSGSNYYKSVLAPNARRALQLQQSVNRLYPILQARGATGFGLPATLAAKSPEGQRILRQTVQLPYPRKELNIHSNSNQLLRRALTQNPNLVSMLDSDMNFGANYTSKVMARAAGEGAAAKPAISSTRQTHSNIPKPQSTPSTPLMDRASGSKGSRRFFRQLRGALGSGQPSLSLPSRPASALPRFRGKGSAGLVGGLLRTLSRA